MKRSILALLLALPLVTFAASAGAEEAKARPSFPMPAADFQARQDAHVAKMRAKLEERITAKKADAEQAKKMRARFEERVGKVQAAVNKAKADGSVTKDEAKEVRKVAHAGRHGKHGKHGQKQGDKK